MFNLIYPHPKLTTIKNLPSVKAFCRGTYLVLLLLSVTACKEETDTLFKLVPHESSSVTFSNEIIENDTLNIIDMEYVYNGGGVGIGDFNNDGLQDIYFTGNVVDNKLYLNQGDLKFKDVTKTAGVEGANRWSSGVAVVDINNDGWLDIYVGATILTDSSARGNLLYVNKGLDLEGVPTFVESAKKFGIDDKGHTTHSAFLDYDKDGDLDLYVLSNYIDEKQSPSKYRPKMVDGSSYNNDQFYRNNGDNTFTNVTKEVGILIEGYGLGLAVTDINQDSWPDIYVSNDYISNDLLWINNQDGTFSNQVSKYFKHQSGSAMGNDVADINNDGLVDVIAVDMMPEDNKRKKMMIRSNSYSTYINNEKFGYEYQYVRNTLQLNNGVTPDGHPVFSEIGQLSGLHQTDWSWAPLLADFDNDGFRDVIISNGFPRDVTDHDFATYASGIGGSLLTTVQLLDSIPEVKIANYAYKNNGDLTFSDKTIDWGLNLPSYSSGAAYADLDNDGDLDLVVNNINDKAFIYENQLYSGSDKKDNQNNFLRIRLEGGKERIPIEGTKILLHLGEGEKLFYEQSVYRGYLSSVETVAHFGLGGQNTVDSIRIIWPDGKQQLLLEVDANQVLAVDYDKAETVPSSDFNREIQLVDNTTIFVDASESLNIRYKHEEQDKVDFNIQVTLPHKFTQNGPGIAVGDIDGNGLDDFFIGGSAENSGIFYLQEEGGTFRSSVDLLVSEAGKEKEDLGVLFFDADNDDDLDLYIVSGSYEFKPGSPELQDRLYINNGEGKFNIDTSALPSFRSNGSVVIAADYDKDGDLDLFISGNVIPGQYPFPDKSFILNNENGKFTDVTEKIAPGLSHIGIVNDAIWSDVDNDGNIDLLVAGEWMPLTLFKSDGNAFDNVTSSTGLQDYVGWWNSLTAGDYDKDGDVDFIAGNLGLNTNFKGSSEQPLSVYAKDFDGNGSIDPIVTTFMKATDGTLKPFPMHAKDDLTFLIPRMKKKFPKYGIYSQASINEVLSSEEMEGALIMHANHLATSYVENIGDGTFKISALPLKAQFAPVFGMLSEDFDKDGNLDVILVGNSYSTEVTTGRYDALIGLYLKGNGKGEFGLMGPESGFFVDGDAKGIATLEANGKQILVVTQNQDSVKTFKVQQISESAEKNIVIKANPTDAYAEIELEDGKKIKHEFYYGSGYLSQSARELRVLRTVKSIKVFDFRGNMRLINLDEKVVVSRE